MMDTISKFYRVGIVLILTIFITIFALLFTEPTLIVLGSIALVQLYVVLVREIYRIVSVP
jgi:hypothetical protein